MSSHSHTPVSSSINKSTSRFAPKVVPRKAASSGHAPPPRPIPTVDEESQSEDELEEEEQTLEDGEPTSTDLDAERRYESIPAIQSSILPSPPVDAAPIPVPTTHLTRSLRSSGPVPDPTVPTSTTPTTTITATTTSTAPTTTGRKRSAATPAAGGAPRRRHRPPPTPPPPPHLTTL